MRQHKTWLSKCNKNNNNKLFKKITNNILIGLLKKVPLINIFFFSDLSHDLSSHLHELFDHFTIL